MAGPSLRQAHAHHAIHEGGLSGAIQKTETLEEYIKEQDEDMQKAAALHLLDYWQTRIISHADAEEEGFYEEMTAKNPALTEAIIGLKRDHDLMRIIAADIKTALESGPVTERVLQQFYALLTVNEIHSREEERLLFQS